MPWTEAQVDDLIASVRRDFALGKTHPSFQQKLQEHGVTVRDAEQAIGKHSDIGQYERNGRTTGFLNPRNNVVVAWTQDTYPSYVKTCFIVKGGLGYLLRQPEIELIWSPK